MGRLSRSIEELIPWLYLKGISTGDYQEALAALRAEAGDELVRLKGLVAIDKLDGPLLIQAVAGQAVEVAPLPAWPGGDEDSRLVVIAAGEDAGTPTRWLEHWRIYLGLADVASA